MKLFTAKVGQILIGADAAISVQTMCNTFTHNIEESVKQIVELAKAGAQIIRLTIQGDREVEALKEIKKRVKEAGYSVPLVADVHFSAVVAIEAAKVADKVRINPGNFAKDHKVAQEMFFQFLTTCKKYNTAVRIGLNHGSLGERIIGMYGDTPLGMKEAALEWIKMCVDNDFYNIVISLKASNTVVMVNAYRLLKEAMIIEDLNFPLHLGVTEAGNGDMGRIKSAVGIATLLKDGIGDTIRVSLTESPINEIPVARQIVDYIESGRNTPTQNYDCESFDEFIIKASCDYGPLLLDRKIDDFNISGTIKGEEIKSEVIADFKDNLLQASRRKFTKPEYIACPGCGRTLYDLEETFNQVKERTSHLKGMVIAVMGCIVNGPGEMADADYGYVGEGKGKVAIYKGKTPVLRGVSQDDAIDALLQIIEQDAQHKDNPL